PAGPAGAAAKRDAPAFLLRADSGIDFVHRRFLTPGKKYLPETMGAGVGLGEVGYGMAVTCPDVDNDGDPDLFVTRVGRDVLCRNNGDGTFTDVTAASGIQDDFWSGPAAWADFDGDGDLDLYLGNYARIDYAHYKVCGTRD